MPNYCDNELSVKGLQKDVVIFLNDFVEKDSSNGDLSFSMNKIVPQPYPCDKEGFDWYHWRLENWGCKWDINNHEYVEDAYDQIVEADFDDYIECNIPYETPWGPNLEFLERASKIYPDLEFNIRYYEPGCELAGDFTYCNGNETENYQFHDGDLADFLIWAIEHDFESLDYVLGDMELEDEEIINKINNYFNPREENEPDEDVLDLRNVFLGNNLPDPE